MKTFQIPILSTRGLAMSLLGLCLLSGLDAPPAHADFTFGKAVNLESVIPVLDPMHDIISCLSSDRLEMYVMRENLPGGHGGWDLWVLRRTSADEDWGSLEDLGPVVNTAKNEGNASISTDGLTLFFESNRSGGYGNNDICMTTRSSKNDPWGQVANLGPKINSFASDVCPWISADGLELYFASWRPGGYGGADIYVAKRATVDVPWGDPSNLGPVVNSPYSDVLSSLSPDGLLLFFSDNLSSREPPRPGGYGGSDMWMTRRASLSDPWQAPVNCGPLMNSNADDGTPRFSPDGCTLYFWSENSSGTYENWKAPILPIVDLNGDGKADTADVFIMLEHWQTNYPLCDIGPYAWGDGIVDAQDLMVLAEYMANNPTDVSNVNSSQ